MKWEVSQLGCMKAFWSPLQPLSFNAIDHFPACSPQPCSFSWSKRFTIKHAMIT